MLLLLLLFVVAPSSFSGLPLLVLLCEALLLDDLLLTDMAVAADLYRTMLCSSVCVPQSVPVTARGPDRAPSRLYGCRDNELDSFLRFSIFSKRVFICTRIYWFCNRELGLIS